MIIVIGEPTDLRVQATISHMEKQGVPFCLFDTITYPYDSKLTQTIDSPAQGSIVVEGTTVPIESITSVYYCVQNGFAPAEDDPPEIQHIVFNNIESAAWSFFHSLDCLFVNPIIPADLHNYKTYVLQQLRHHGIRVPDTLVTNNPDDVVSFYHQQQGDVIYKPPWGQSFTAKLTQEELQPSHLSRLANSPIMLQEYIPGNEVRAYVIGENVFGVKVESDYVDINQDEHAKRVAFDLPPHAIELSKKVAQAVNLVFTAIDMRVTDDGEFVVLEANSSPDFTADQYQTGYPLCQTLIELLQKG